MLDKLCGELLDIIEDYSNEKTLRFLNKDINKNLQIYTKPTFICLKCNKMMLYKNNFYDKGCIKCTVKTKCHECKRYNFLFREDACADWECCYKYICHGGCIFECDKCKNIYKDVKNMYKLEGSELFYCINCIDKEITYESAELWLGPSIEEYYDRYGY